MKKFLLFVVALFVCGVAFAHTVNWHDGNTTTQTTCTAGDNITPPTPIGKYGYHLKKWLEYIPIEYLESIDDSYIDTSFYPNQDTSVKTKMQLNYIGQGPYGFGSSGKYEFFLWGRSSFLYNSAYNGKDMYTGDIIEIDWNKNNIKYYINNVLQPEITATYSSFNTEYSLYLFALKRSRSSPQFVGGVKMYYFQMYDNNVLIRDFVPALDANGTPCMYDKVERKFYYNIGTGQFIAGPVLTE